MASVLRFVLILNALALGLCSRLRCREQPVLPSTSSLAVVDCGVPLAVAELDLLDHAEHELYLACALAVILLFFILIVYVLTRDVCSCRLSRWTQAAPPGWSELGLASSLGCCSTGPAPPRLPLPALYARPGALRPACHVCRCVAWLRPERS